MLRIMVLKALKTFSLKGNLRIIDLKLYQIDYSLSMNQPMRWFNLESVVIDREQLSPLDWSNFRLYREVTTSKLFSLSNLSSSYRIRIIECLNPDMIWMESMNHAVSDALKLCEISTQLLSLVTKIFCVTKGNNVIVPSAQLRGKDNVFRACHYY